ncbi:MAG: DUF2975 domain-containing protein [Melioribacteraceae bacterium]
MEEVQKFFKTDDKPYTVFGFSVREAVGILLQAVIIFIGIGAFIFMLWEPHIEGRNAHSTLFEIYFNDPFLAFAYIASIPFYMGIYNAVKVLGYYRQNNVVSKGAVKSLRTIKLCALSIIGSVFVGEIFIMMNESDDRAGGVFMGFLIISISVGIAAAASKFQKNLQNVLDETVIS